MILRKKKNYEIIETFSSIDPWNLNITQTQIYQSIKNNSTLLFTYGEKTNKIKTTTMIIKGEKKTKRGSI